MYYGYNYVSGGSYLGSLASTLASFLFWALVIVGFAYLIRWSWDLAGQKFGQQKPAVDSFEIIKQRYARGEISREEYLSLKEDLSAL
ncbi:SHOCT domain-containing protein [Sporomusa acidovorans]|uniref:SHOCT domain-containing protein n=1 Tax=Sporomusa acidovorans TaxID=112900 RepID=UPI0008911BE0|nr:SHOCT domain-containing protein [Sporomusa acidovorans]OZC18982.1 hypothetical protein SPACI_30680 [Sporomusa acidovorans DSM 3132]SDD71983.1 putative membrane protein [Sporomusa acidovorans]